MSSLRLMLLKLKVVEEELDVEMVIPSTATAIPVWNDGNSYKNVAGITNSLKQIDQELANYEVEQKDFLDKNGLSISLVDLSNFDAMGIHNGVGDPELSQVFYSKGSTSNSTNSLMPISLQGNQTNVQGENKPIPLELYGQAKELLEKRQVILAKKKYTQDYLDEHARKVGEKRGKPNWKPTQLDNVTEYAKTYADSYVYAHSLYPNTLLSTFSELLLERPEIAGMKLATNSLSDFQKKQWQEAYNDAINEAKGASPDDKEMYKELNQLIQKDSEGFSSNAITNSFPKYKGFDLGKEFEDQLMSRFSGTDADGNSTAPNAARYSGEKGEDGKGMLNKEDAEKFKGINKADQTQGNPIKILGWRKDANSPTGFVYDFRIKSDGDLGKVYEADVPANFTQVMDFYGLFNRTLIPNDTNNELNTLDGNLWRQAVDSKHKNGVRVPYGANSYKAEIEALTRGDYEGNAPTNFYKLHLPYVDNTGKKRYKTDIFHSYAEAEAAYKQALLNVLSTAQPKVYAEIMATLGQNGITDLQGVVDYNTGKK
jgi:hypothetical protein